LPCRVLKSLACGIRCYALLASVVQMVCVTRRDATRPESPWVMADESLESESQGVQKSREHVTLLCCFCLSFGLVEVGQAVLCSSNGNVPKT